MDIEDLRLLEAVAAEGSFSRAAARLRLSQPSVSARIAMVERTIGAELFVRDSRGARLTAAGQRYLTYVRRCLQLLEQGSRAAGQEAAPLIRVGVPSSYAPALAPMLADAAAAKHVRVSIRAGHSTELRDDLLDGTLELVFAVPGAVPPGILSRPAAESPIVALVRPPGPESGQRFALHSWSQDADNVIAEMLSADGSAADIMVVSPAAAAIALAAYRGYTAIVPRITATPELESGLLQLAPIRLPKLTARLDYLYSSRHPGRDQIEAIGLAVRRAARTRPPAVAGAAP